MATAGASPCFAIVAPGLEPILGAELSALGIRVEGAEAGGVRFTGSIAAIQSANLHLRTASRIVVRLGEFPARHFSELSRACAALAWARYVSPGTPVRLSVTCRKSRLYHSGAVAERVGEAIARVAGADVSPARAERDDADEDDAQLILVRLLHDRCTVSVDASGALLHRRGYRLATAKAPVRETLAAAMLLAAGYAGDAPLADPLCGSGTIAIEGALIARRIAPGSRRRFAFERWPTHDAGSWGRVLDDARAREIAHARAPILAADRDAGAIDAARSNAARAGVEGDIAFARQALSALAPPAGRGWLVTNPPYGVRVGERRALRDLYAQLGNVARRACAGWTVALLSAHAELDRHTRLPFTTRFRTRNGGVPVRCVSCEVPAADPTGGGS